MEPSLSALIRLVDAMRAVDNASSIEEVKEIRDKAEALRVYCRRASVSLKAFPEAAQEMTGVTGYGGILKPNLPCSLSQSG